MANSYKWKNIVKPLFERIQIYETLVKEENLAMEVRIQLTLFSKPIDFIHIRRRIKHNKCIMMIVINKLVSRPLACSQNAGNMYGCNQ